MSTLRIYADEAGTMPLKDDDQVFVVAAVSLIGSHPDAEAHVGRAEWVHSRLKHIKATPHCCYVQPGPGYAELISSKFEKMDLMARTTCLLNGANTEYLPSRGGLPFRNTIWVQGMQSMLQGPLLDAVMCGPITSVDLYLDQKTMASETRALFQAQLDNLKSDLLDAVHTLARLSPRRAKDIIANTRFDSINIHWSDDIETTDCDHGLKLAHYVASLTYQDLLTGRQTFTKLIEGDGHQRFMRNITPLLTRPLHDDTIRAW